MPPAYTFRLAGADAERDVPDPRATTRLVVPQVLMVVADDDKAPRPAAVPPLPLPLPPPPPRTPTAAWRAAAPALRARQEAISTIPSTYGSLRAGPDPGAVVGITLGAVGGFIALLFLLYTCINMAGGGGDGATSVGTASFVTPSFVTPKTRRPTRTNAHAHAHAHAHSHAHHRHASRSRSRSRSRSHRRRETVEVHRTTAHGQSVLVEERAPGGERIVVEERRRSVSRPAPAPAPAPVPAPPPPPPPPPPDEESEDEIVVIEEQAPRRHRSRRRSSVERRAEYREIRRTSGTR